MSKGGGVSSPSPSEYIPLVQEQAEVNRTNTVTPFASTIWSQGATPSTTDQMQTFTVPDSSMPILKYGETSALPSSNFWNPYDGADDGPELTPTNDEDFNPWRPAETAASPVTSSGPWTATQSFSPELQALYEQQFGGDGYQSYEDRYMENARRLLDPIYDRQSENFEQSMANRGTPVGGELYDDSYRNLMKAQNEGYQDAAFGALQFGEGQRLNDWNRLMAAMGTSQVQGQPVDVMGPYNAANQMNMYNDNIQAQERMNMWDNIFSLVPWT